MARDIFLYGTLRDPGQLAAVLGHGDAVLRTDRLAGHTVRADAGTGSFPVLVDDPSGVAEGVVLKATPSDLARLDWYEAIYDYERRAVTLASGETAEAYFAPRSIRTSGAWNLDEWLSVWGAGVELTAREVMDEFPATPPGDMGRRYNMALARAFSHLRARSETVPGGVRKGAGRKGVALVRRTSRHRGIFALDEVDLDHRRFDGGRETIRREVFVGTDAALVLPYDPRRDRIVLIEQFRPGPWRRGDNNPWCLEPVAGLVDAGETPEDCARREALEEAGVVLRRLVRVPGGYPSPGATTEYFHLFVGLADLSQYRPLNAGQAHEGEDILSHPMTLGAALELVETGEASVLPLAYLLTWTAANRDKLLAADRH